MSIIHKICVAAKCHPANNVKRKLINCFHNKVIVGLRYADKPDDNHEIILSDKDTLINNFRYAVVHAAKNLNIPFDGKNDISVEWLHQSCSVKFTLMLDSDEYYDHVKTDAILCDRNIKINKGTYSVCYPAFYNFADVYVTIYTK